MTQTVTITGQISGNRRLLDAISTIDSKYESISFNGFQVTYPTKAAAKKALWYAYKYLVSQEPDFKSMIKYSKYGSLSYDASRAEINS